MPKKYIEGKFEIDPNFDMKNYLEKRIEEIQNVFERQLKIIDGLEDSLFQLICMFSLLDCMAQEWDNYPDKKQADIFCDFLLAHQSSFDYLDKVEPITLYYHIEDLIEKESLIPGMPEEPVISLDSLGNLDLKCTKEIIETNIKNTLWLWISSLRALSRRLLMPNLWKVFCLRSPVCATVRRRHWYTL